MKRRFAKIMMRFCQRMAMASTRSCRYWSEQYLEWARRYYCGKEQ